MSKLIVEKARDFGRARQLPLLSLMMFEPLLVSRILILREEGSSDLEPLKLRYMQLRRGNERQLERIGRGTDRLAMWMEDSGGD